MLERRRYRARARWRSAVCGCGRAADADPWGGQRAIFTAHGTVNREDWDLTWNIPLDGGGLLVSTDIRIEIETEAVLQP